MSTWEAMSTPLPPILVVSGLVLLATNDLNLYALTLDAGFATQTAFLLTPHNMLPGSRKGSSKSTAMPLSQSPQSTLSVTGTTKTSSEIVMSTTTEATSQWFSLPYWRRRNVSQPTSPQHRSSENIPARLATSRSSRLLSLDKPLPLTPSGESGDSKVFGVSAALQYRSSHFPTYQQESDPPAVQNSSRSAPVGMPTSRGLCTSLASVSAREEPNISSPIIPNTLYPTSSPVEIPSQQIRRSKSAHRLRATNDTSVTSETLVDRRCRGLSFGATNMLPDTVTTKGKGKELEPSPDPPKPQSLSRKASFWSKKKSLTPAPPAPPVPQNDNAISVLPLPLVDVSPFAPEFTIQPFQLNNPNPKPMIVSSFQLQPDHATARRTTPGSTTTSSTTSFDVVDLPFPNQEATRPSRGHATPPLLHRLSFGVFSSPEPSPIVRPRLLNRPHSQSATLPFPSSPKPIIQVPRPSIDGESPEEYVSRLKTHVSKAEVASVLASSSDMFYARALRAYLNQFEFLGIPLDVALRKILMEVGLPRETQQIDRVMEAFAFRYRQCNPQLFTSDDHPYILAFSLIMLHTDAFNPSNKRKMTKTDYIKNTKLPGIPTEVLDCFFDNIVFAPFIFIEDPEDIDNSSGLTVDLTGSVSTSTSLPSAGLTTPFKTTNKVDPYYLIMNDQLDPLRVDVNSYILPQNPFTYEGTDGPWDEEYLHSTFLNTRLIDADFPFALRSSTLFSLSPSVSAVSPDSCQQYQDTCRLKVIKAGVLNKKDDLAEGGKKALSRKWKTWGVILSDSHLLFCRDPTLAPVFSAEPCQQAGGAGHAKFRPDDTYSLKDSIAVYDHSYKKYNHTFRFVLPDGRHLLLQAANDKDFQQWISCINYACTFKSAGVRMRPADAPDGLIHPSGTATSTPHLHDLHNRVHGRRPLRTTVNEYTDMSTGQIQNKPKTSTGENPVDDLYFTKTSPEKGNLAQSKSMFKTDLTSPVDDNALPVRDDYISESPLMYSRFLTSKNLRSPPRSQLVMKKIRELDTKITPLQLRLESDERHARNIAILTPFRKTTRSKLSAVIHNMAKPLMRMRLEMEKLRCYRTVLLSDLVSEKTQTERIALRGVTDPLRQRRPKTAPTMLSRTYDDFGKQSSTPASLSNSTSGSFHSARESAFDWPSELAGDTALHGSPKQGFHGIAPTTEPEDVLLGTPPSRSEDNLKDSQYRGDSSSENDDDDEQAEDWNKTRVAHRVSLIHVPPDFVISTRLKAVMEGNNDQG